MTAVLPLLVLLPACREPNEQSYPSLVALGRPADSSEIAAWDIDVDGSGHGLPAGRGDTAAGARIYAALCASCHGSRGEGSATASQLVKPDTGRSGRRNIASHWPYAPPLFGYIRRAMPPDRPGTLTADSIYALVAFLLDANGIEVPGGSADSSSLRRVTMPALPLFVADDRKGGPEIR